MAVSFKLTIFPKNNAIENIVIITIGTANTIITFVFRVIFFSKRAKIASDAEVDMFIAINKA